jgi:hypothetical protein
VRSNLVGWCTTQGTITTADASCTLARTDNQDTLGTLTVSHTGAAAGQSFTGTITGTRADLAFDEGSSFTPAKASGDNIGGLFYAILENVAI